MKMKLSDREWKEFEIEKVFKVFNSFPYHKKDLKSVIDSQKYIVYISRTNKNNGVEDIVEKGEKMKINPPNIIVFGAENARFFYQPFNTITGNKIYGMKNKNINKFTGLFLQQMLNSSVKDCGFNYGQGLTGTREKRRKIILPVEKNNEKLLDWEFMETYSKQLYNEKKFIYNKYCNNMIKKIKFKEILPLKSKEWKEFFLVDLFKNILRGKRLTKADQKEGKIPYVSSTIMNNGVDNYISNEKGVRIFSKCMTIANSGSVGASFYHPYEFIASDHVTHLKNEKMNKYIYLFISTMTKRFSEKYNFNREINDKRILREKIMLPIDENNNPDYQYMEQYIKNIMIKKIEVSIKKIF